MLGDQLLHFFACVAMTMKKNDTDPKGVVFVLRGRLER